MSLSHAVCIISSISRALNASCVSPSIPSRAHVQIANLSAELAGLYTCVAVSERGAEATGTLVCVAERPPAPGAPRVAGQSGSSVKLEWAASPEPALPALPYPLPGVPLELFRRALQTLFYCIEFSTNGALFDNR